MIHPRLFSWAMTLVYLAALAVLVLDLLVWRPN